MNLAFSNIANAFVNFVYPPACSTCWRNLDRNEFYICHNCWDGFERVAPTETIIQVIESKFLSDRYIDKIDSVFLFEQDPRVRMAIHLLKYSGAERIADHFGSFIAGKIADDDKLSASDIVVPVPLHPARKRERGYNQSELIANQVGRKLGIKNDNNLLKRTRQTQTQTLFDAEGRRKNIAGAFCVSEGSGDFLAGKNVLLIDDVITTGSTIRECARVLKESGAASVYAASAAITI